MLLDFIQLQPLVKLAITLQLLGPIESPRYSQSAMRLASIKPILSIYFLVDGLVFINFYYVLLPNYLIRELRIVLKARVIERIDLVSV